MSVVDTYTQPSWLSRLIAGGSGLLKSVLDQAAEQRAQAAPGPLQPAPSPTQVPVTPPDDLGAPAPLTAPVASLAPAPAPTDGSMSPTDQLATGAPASAPQVEAQPDARTQTILAAQRAGDRTNGGMGGPNDHNVGTDLMTFVLGGGRALLAEKQQRQMLQLAQIQAAKQRAQLYTDADNLGLTGREREVFITDPQEWAKQSASRYAATDLAPGALRTTLGDQPQVANPDTKPMVVGSSLVSPQGQPLYTAPSEPKVGDGGAYTKNADGSWSFHLAPKIQTVKDAMGNEHVVVVSGDAAANAPQVATPQAPTGGVYDRVAAIAQDAGATDTESAYLRRLAQVESAGNTAAQNGRSTGLFQFHPDTFASAGGKNIADVGDQTKAALNLSRQYRVTLQQNGVTPSDANTYIMHQQGAGGGLALLTAPPEVSAVAALTPAYGDAATAKKAIVNNGGSPDMTAGQFTDMWRQRWNGSASDKTSSGGSPTGAVTAKEVYSSAPNGGPGGHYGSNTDLQGDDFLKTLPNGYAQQVKAIANGDLAMPSSFVMKTPYGQKLMSDIMQYDPTASAVNLPSRQATRKYFTSGQGGANITAINTALGHVDTLDRSIDNLGNATILPGMINPVWNAVAGQLDPNFQQSAARFKAAKTAVASEFTKVWRGTGGAEADIQGYLKQLDEAASPIALHETVKTLVDLLNSRLQSIGQQYSQGMGKISDPLSLLAPDKAKILARYVGEPAAAAVPGMGNAQGSGGAPGWKVVAVR